MKCLVTGASGYIGNALVKRLVEEGYIVVGLIHNKKPEYPKKNVKYFFGDVTDIDSLKNLEGNFDIVFHCAAYVKDYGSRRWYYKVNYEGTKNIVAILNKNKIKKFIYLGHINYESRMRMRN